MLGGFWGHIQKGTKLSLTDLHKLMELCTSRSSRPEMFLRKDVLKIYSKFTGEHPCRNAISINLLCNFIEIALRDGCSPVNMLHILKTTFPRNTSGWLLLYQVL